VKRVLGAACLALAVLAGCGKDGKGGGAAALPERTSPEVPRVKEVVETLLGAVGSADAEAVVRRVATPELADRVLAASRASKPRNVKWEVGDVEVWGETAVARVRLTYPEAAEGTNAFTMTYDLVKTPEGWRVSAYRLRGDWEEEG
jgi:hypothetical protein